jgi:hypothetical protein
MRKQTTSRSPCLKLRLLSSALSLLLSPIFFEPIAIMKRNERKKNKTNLVLESFSLCIAQLGGSHCNNCFFVLRIIFLELDFFLWRFDILLWSVDLWRFNLFLGNRNRSRRNSSRRRRKSSHGRQRSFGRRRTFVFCISKLRQKHKQNFYLDNEASSQRPFQKPESEQTDNDY